MINLLLLLTLDRSIYLKMHYIYRNQAAPVRIETWVACAVVTCTQLGLSRKLRFSSCLSFPL
jgi:hypothetical protein